ncbi:phospholipid carrier-dependent glycosyltransferase [Promineifilum sp.]|uniref:phospholipid carrier-dependent glycosyltransferase n=1 Tax=Promineifilum sp. TaxID=2664178 RepID=UPI0035B49DFA
MVEKTAPRGQWSGYFPLTLVLGIYLILAVGYGVVVPLFETPDEHLHYFTAEYMAREGRLPSALTPGPMGQEAAQPPLYYALGALIVRAVGDSSAEGQLWLNPRAVLGQFDRRETAWPPINSNMFVHSPAEAWPWQGYALAAHLLRLLSTLMGLGTLLCLHAAGRAVWPDAPERALLATALVAFLPQFAFVHAAVSNDAAITLFSTAAIWQLLRIRNHELEIRNEDTQAAVNGSELVARRSSLVILGLTIGLAILSKAAGILLLVFAVGVLALWALRAGGPRRWARAAAGALWVAGPALLLAGWLLWRNWALYGDATAATPFVELTTGYRPYSLRQVWGDLDRVWLSLFAVFGWMSVGAPAWVYGVWTGIAGAAATGGGWWMVRSLAVAGERGGGGARGQGSGGAGGKKPASEDADSVGGLVNGSSASEDADSVANSPPAPPPPRSPASLLLSVWFALVAAGWLLFMLRTPADQGRLFFPAIAPLALGAAFGLSRWPRPARWAAVAGALVTSAYCLLAVIPNAYARPPVVAAVPAEAMPLDATFPEGPQLLGATVNTPAARAGDWVWVTLYWRRAATGGADAPMAHLELFGRGFERVGLQVAYHGRGLYPAALWPPEGVVADRLAVRVADDIAGPAEGQLRVKLDEDAAGVDVGRVKIVPAAWPPATAPLATLGESIELAGAELSTATAAPGETVEVRLRWQVAAPPGPALLHVFVHLGNPTQPPLAQSDGPVMAGEYPARLWAASEVFEETVALALPADLPPGDYPIQFGLYDFDSGERRPVVVDGQRQPTDTYPVGRLTIE